MLHQSKSPHLKAKQLWLNSHLPVIRRSKDPFNSTSSPGHGTAQIIFRHFLSCWKDRTQDNKKGNIFSLEGEERTELRGVWPLFFSLLCVFLTARKDIERTCAKLLVSTVIIVPQYVRNGGLTKHWTVAVHLPVSSPWINPFFLTGQCKIELSVWVTSQPRSANYLEPPAQMKPQALT